MKLCDLSERKKEYAGVGGGKKQGGQSGSATTLALINLTSHRICR